MDLSSLKAIIHEVRSRTSGRTVLLFGSSSLLASFPNDPPPDIGVEMTLDADFFIDPDDLTCRSDLHAYMGINEAYHSKYGYYADFVDLRMADAFPEGWRDRLVAMEGFDDVFALDPVDMSVTKVAATARNRLSLRMSRGGKDRGLKDIRTIVALLKAGKIEWAALQERLRAMDWEPALVVEAGRVMAEISERLKADSSAN